jgi:secreted trypsin-like serine protease
VIAFGWPNTGNNQVLQTAKFQIKPTAECKTNRPVDPTWELCTDNIEPDSPFGTCDASLGSPVIQERCHTILVGIVVGTQKPCLNPNQSTTIFANLAVYREWIFQIAGEGRVCPCE